MSTSRVYSLWLPEDLMERVDRQAAEAGLSRNAHIRELLRGAAFGGGTDVFADDSFDAIVVKQPPHG